MDFAPGYDQSTMAAQFFGGQSLHSASFLDPEQGTVEFLFRPDTRRLATSLAFFLYRA